MTNEKRQFVYITADGNYRTIEIPVDQFVPEDSEHGFVLPTEKKGNPPIL